MGTLEDCSCSHSEVQLALVAAIEAILAGGNAILAAASRTGNTVRPKSLFEVKPRSLCVGDHCEELEGADSALAHVSIVVNSREGVKYYLYFSCIIFQYSRRNYCADIK